MSVWSHWRGNAPAFDLATLGGSQTGLRVMRRLDGTGRINAQVRLSSSGAIGDGLEGAAGVSWQPLRRIPAALVVERRAQLAGDGGRSAFAAFAAGGVTDAPLHAGWRIDSYGAAGIVGGGRQDAFAEASAVVHRPLSRAGKMSVDGGIGGWAAAQPGVSRVDVGPRVSVILPIGAARPRLAVDYRYRVGGNAAPDSGLALTLASDF